MSVVNSFEVYQGMIWSKLLQQVSYRCCLDHLTLNGLRHPLKEVDMDTWCEIVYP